jgi:pimeloyl-ACP methyl ester carboxylesterase
MGKHDRELASLLADRFTVVLMDRRGRGRSGPPADGDGRVQLAKEVEDLDAVLRATDARRVLGHSAGGLIALEAARALLGIERLAVYEPALSVKGSMPLSWLPRLEEALARDDVPEAFVSFVTGLELGPHAWIPQWLMKLPLKLLPRGEERAELLSLLKTLPRDARMAVAADAPDLSRFSSIGARTLAMRGDQTPAYITRLVDELAAVIPGAQRMLFEGANHNAPDLDPKRIADALATFLA